MSIAARRMQKGGSGVFTSQKIVLPPYWYPPSTYDTQLDAAGGAKVPFVINNINSGPGADGAESNFQTMMAGEQAAGIKTLGYVYSNYGDRDIGDVETDIDNWYAWYPMYGIHIDEAPAAGWSTEVQEYYLALYNYIKGLAGSSPNVLGTTVFLNAGTITDEYSMNCADVIQDFEDVEANYAGATFPSWTLQYPAHRFWNTLHDSAGTTEALVADINLSRSRNKGYIYITTGTGANPYTVLPSNPFWTDELSMLTL